MDEDWHLKQIVIVLYMCRYRDKFGFPFVICARENKKEAILAGLETRIENSSQVEIETGLKEVAKICRLRLADIVKDNSSNL